MHQMSFSQTNSSAVGGLDLDRSLQDPDGFTIELNQLQEDLH